MSTSSNVPLPPPEEISRLVTALTAMGFSKKDAHLALHATHYQLDNAALWSESSAAQQQTAAAAQLGSRCTMLATGC